MHNAHIAHSREEKRERKAGRGWRQGGIERRRRRASPTTATTTTTNERSYSRCKEESSRSGERRAREPSRYTGMDGYNIPSVAPRSDPEGASAGLAGRAKAKGESGDLRTWSRARGERSRRGAPAQQFGLFPGIRTCLQQLKEARRWAAARIGASPEAGLSAPVGINDPCVAAQFALVL